MRSHPQTTLAEKLFDLPLWRIATSRERIADQVAQLEAQLRMRDTQVINLRADVATLKRMKKRFEGEALELETLRAEFAALEETLSAECLRKLELLEEIKGLKAETSQLRHDLINKVQLVNMHSDENLDLSEDIQRLEDERACLQSQNKQLREAIESTGMEAQTYRAELIDAHAHTANLEAQLRSLGVMPVAPAVEEEVPF